ncbi:hypothetical protein GX50_02896 [[Emmonsia] crescens]|uniref:Uncharacterized protein n=1 Tax=[Emmonsia] crescens TaxID=73230 RepID=A0A2B7ZMB6_9EURO|nr:hypothetical protein GX50_02896 [Emmonsia crescens]
MNDSLFSIPWIKIQTVREARRIEEPNYNWIPESAKYRKSTPTTTEPDSTKLDFEPGFSLRVLQSYITVMEGNITLSPQNTFCIVNNGQEAFEQRKVDASLSSSPRFVTVMIPYSLCIGTSPYYFYIFTNAYLLNQALWYENIKAPRRV